MPRRAAWLSTLAVFSIVLGSPHAGLANGPVTLLQALDKVTARVSELEAPFDTPVRFGTLTITARACHKTPPEEPPESAAYLEITEARQGQPQSQLFQGWMFASSPGLSALEHPVYDIWVLDCIDRPKESEGSGG